MKRLICTLLGHPTSMSAEGQTSLLRGLADFRSRNPDKTITIWVYCICGAKKQAFKADPL